ncbi:MAG: ATP synthase F0 subunit B, partial [Chloroflexi bacterium]|nr:ATP synthase F0 subunit B [Chloroflexota bacterium]
MLFSPSLAEEAAAGPGLIVQPYWVLVALVQFLILVFLLQKFLWGPITSTLAQRAARIREGLEAAATAKRDREEMKAEVERLLAEARREAAALAERAAQAAEAAATQMRNEARAEAERIR